MCIYLKLWLIAVCLSGKQRKCFELKNMAGVIYMQQANIYILGKHITHNKIGR